MGLYETYINKLIENLNENEFKGHEIDIVLDSGGFKGAYLYGALLYLKQLEKKKKIKINRISGSSIGAVLGTLYILDKLDLYEDLYDKVAEDFKKNMNFNKFNELLESIGKSLDKSCYKKLNNKLFVNFFDVTEKKELVVSEYKNNNHVIECMKYTSYIPIITDGNLHYNNKVDGARPFIFNSRSKYENNILYIDLNFMGKLNYYLNNTHDKNGASCILKGIMEIHDFFLLKTNTTMCSYVNNWKLYDYGFHRLKELLWIVFIYLMMFSSFIYKKLNPCLSSSSAFNLIRNIFKKFVIDIYIKVVFT